MMDDMEEAIEFRWGIEWVLEFELERGEDVKAQVSLCLVGKLSFTQKNCFNLGVIKQKISKVWRPREGLVITDLEENLFPF